MKEDSFYLPIRGIERVFFIFAVTHWHMKIANHPEPADNDAPFPISHPTCAAHRAGGG
ncbi:hypothetical protein D3C85_1842180 [compost metagenome]